MADYSAIYETAESIAELLRNGMVPEPVAKREQIGVCEPQSPEDYQLTVWIYGIEEQKETGPMSGYIPDPDNPLIERFAPTQLKLRILISAHSKAPAIQKYSDEYRIIGRAMQLIKDNPSIPTQYLSGSVARQSKPVLMEVVKLGFEELTRIWNNTQKTIRPSFGVDVTQVYINSDRVRTIGPRVATVNVDIHEKKQNKGSESR